VNLTELVENNLEALVDGITKDAIRRIPSYGKAPIKLTLARVERLLRILQDSVRYNDPNILLQFLERVAEERRQRAYPIGELHAILDITEEHLQNLVEQSTGDALELNAQRALVDAIMDSARMVFSKAYLLLAEGKA